MGKNLKLAFPFNQWKVLLMREILHQLVASSSYYVQRFIHPRWLAGFLPLTVTWIILWNMAHGKDKIATFWSHSWHGSRWQKISTLFLLYNGWVSASQLIQCRKIKFHVFVSSDVIYYKWNIRKVFSFSFAFIFIALFLVTWLAKVVFGTLAALLMSTLFACGILPGFSRLAIFPEIPFSIWGLTTGILVTLLLFCFGRPKQEVFFDRICIHPGDEALKLDAIFSLAGILKESKDSTKKRTKNNSFVRDRISISLFFKHVMSHVFFQVKRKGIKDSIQLDIRRCWCYGTKVGVQGFGVYLSWPHFWNLQLIQIAREVQGFCASPESLQLVWF